LFRKGIARYCDIEAGDGVNPKAAWYYPDPSPGAEMIRDHTAFWHGVKVVDDGEA